MYSVPEVDLFCYDMYNAQSTLHLLYSVYAEDSKPYMLHSL